MFRREKYMHPYLRTDGILDLAVDRAKLVSEELLGLVKDTAVGSVRDSVRSIGDDVGVVLRTTAVPGEEL